MIRWLALAAVLSFGCEKKGAEVTARDALVAINANDLDRFNRRMVLASKLAELVECRGSESEWLTGRHRQSWHRDLRMRIEREFWRGGASVELVELTPVDEASWTVFEVGEQVGRGCVARQPFGVQTYQMRIAIISRLGDRRELGFEVSMWTFDKNWFLWSSPLG